MAEYLVAPSMWTFNAPEIDSSFRAIIDDAIAAEFQRESARLEDEALLCAIALASTDGEHGVSKPREIVRVVIQGRPISEDHFRILDTEYPMRFGRMELG